MFCGCGAWAGFTTSLCKICRAEFDRRAALQMEEMRRAEHERKVREIEAARTLREHELMAQARAHLVTTIKGLTGKDVDASLQDCLQKLRAAHPVGVYPEAVKLELTVVHTGPVETGVGFAFGGLPDHAASPLALRIAHAGLEHWQPGSGSRAEELLSLLMEVVNGRGEMRAFFKSSPCGINDPRWAEVIYTTCAMAVYASGREDVDDEVFPFRQIDAFACKCKHGALDRFTALATDPCWDKLQPPFDWLCACSVLPLLQMDVPRPSYARTSGLQRLSTQRMQKAVSWMEKSPDTAFKLL